MGECTMSDLLARFGVSPIINGNGPVTRLSGGIMAAEVAAAMTAASQVTVDMWDLQAAACRVIARATGAEAGIVTSGASAAILLGAAACLAGLDPGRMNRLPEVADNRQEFIVVRSQRNMYDRALAVAGGRIVEVGIPDRYSGPGVRDADVWEIADAITPRTAGIYFLAQPQSLPVLADVVAVARAAGVPVLVDAAAQLPPAGHLRRFLAEGADLVAFSGGKAIGGPQSSGILAGRVDLVSSALMQMMDMDVAPTAFRAPAEFGVLNQMRGLPQHGIGRSCKIGKEEILSLLVALERFTGMDVATRRGAWCALLQAVNDAARLPDGRILAISDDEVPLLIIIDPAPSALQTRLAAHDPPIHVRHGGDRLLISPLALAADAVSVIAQALSNQPAKNRSS